MSAGQADAITKWVDRWGHSTSSFDGLQADEGAPAVPPLTLSLATQVLDFPRHLGIHSGGMVMADRPLVEFCPVEWARMENRSVLQWDKDDCASAGLVKFDLLGLGMLTMLHLAVDLVREHEGVEIDLATIPQEPEVYALLCAADTIGVFQVESRAQMATLPRLRPEKFYDLVVEVALIRPGPIQGGSVHPYLRRRNGEEPVTYPHPLLERCLKKTLGRAAVPGAAHADGDRRGRLQRRRSPTSCARRWARSGLARAWRPCVTRLLAGMAERGHHRRRRRRDREEARGVRRLRLPREPLGELRLPRVLELVDQAALPGGVRVPRCSTRSRWASTRRTRIVRDAVRHGVEVLGPCVEPRPGATARWRHGQSRPVPSVGRSPGGTRIRRSMRCASGCATCAACPTRLLDRIDDDARGRRVHRPRGLHPSHRRAVDALEVARDRGRVRAASSSTGAPRCGPRGALRDARPATLPGLVTGVDAPTLPGMTEIEETAADLWATGMSTARASHRVRARPAGDAGRGDRGGLRELARPFGGRGRRGGDAPPATGDGERRGVHQPRGRDRPRQRDLHPRRVEAVPQGGPAPRRRCGCGACWNATRA